MADSKVGLLINLNDSDKEIDEIEKTRMVADPEMADCIMQSPTLPHHSAGSDDLIMNEEFNFDIPLSPTSNVGNSTFTKEAPDVIEPVEQPVEDEDEVFFGPVGFTEVVVKKAAEEQEADTKMWSALTDAEMNEVFSEANRMVDLIQEARETKSDETSVTDKQGSAASPSLQSKRVPSLSKIMDSATKSGAYTSAGPSVNSFTVTKSPGTVSVSKESLKEVQTKLFSPSSSPKTEEKKSLKPKTGVAATPSSSGQALPKPNSAPASRPVRRTQSLYDKSRRSGSGLKPPSSGTSLLQEPKVAGTKRKKLDMNQSVDDLHTSLNSSNSSETTSESNLPAAKSRLSAPLADRTSGLKRPCIKSSLQPPKAGLAKRTKLDGHHSSDELHTSLNSSTSSDISVDGPSQASTRRSLPLPSKPVSKLPSGLRKPGGNAPAPSGISQRSASTSGPPAPAVSSAAKPAIKSNLTKLDKLKSSLGAGVSRLSSGTSRLVKPGSSTSLLARPSGPLKALKPAGQPAVPKRPVTTASKKNTSLLKTPPKSGKPSEDRRKSIGSPAGHMTPKRTGVSRSQSFSGQRTPSQKAKESTGSTPGSAQRRSLLPTVNKRERTLSSNSSIPSYGSSIGDTSSVLAEIQNIADASPSCFKPKTARILHTPLAKGSTAKSKVSRWSPVARRKPMSGEEYFTCTKRFGAPN